MSREYERGRGFGYSHRTPHPHPSAAVEELIPTNVISGFATVSCSALCMDVAHSLAIILPYYDSWGAIATVCSTSTVELHESQRASVLLPTGTRQQLPKTQGYK